MSDNTLMPYLTQIGDRITIPESILLGPKIAGFWWQGGIDRYGDGREFIVEVFDLNEPYSVIFSRYVNPMSGPQVVSHFRPANCFNGSCPGTQDERERLSALPSSLWFHIGDRGKEGKRMLYPDKRIIGWTQDGDPRGFMLLQEPMVYTSICGEFSLGNSFVSITDYYRRCFLVPKVDGNVDPLVLGQALESIMLDTWEVGKVAGIFGRPPPILAEGEELRFGTVSSEFFGELGTWVLGNLRYFEQTAEKRRRNDAIGSYNMRPCSHRADRCFKDL